MIANPSYQLFVDNKPTTDLKYGLAALKTLAEGETCVINEENPSDSTAINIDDLKVFSLYQKVRNDKGELVLIKHGGALPIVVHKVRNKTFKAPAAGTPQYWIISASSSFEPCCKDYGIRFGLYNDAIQKTMFPSELVETFGVKQKCCEGDSCGTVENYSRTELFFRLWGDVVARGKDKGYVSAYLSMHGSVDNDTIIATPDGKMKFGVTVGGTTTTYEVEEFSDIDFADNTIKYKKKVGSNTATNETDFSAFIAAMESAVSTNPISIVFAIAAEAENQYGQMNFKYDVIRNSRARVTLNGGFDCATGVTKKNNDAASSGIYIGATLGTTGTEVSAFAYSIGQKYDVHEMELADSLHTLNSPYTLSDITLSENGIKFRATQNGYYLLTIEYQQPSDGVTRVEHHPWGTTIAIVEHTSNYTNWEYFLNLFSPSGETWAIHS